ncbi:Survival protein SurE-like phosphatase/nucleotidase [Kalmanozyma brasiliensis GHG001]|uniref:Putative tubulin-tyrosine ligase n=1 Tax=Kalmanozyma brasiliensis (strain GHG001) TaxID=1365824 RepID=V5GMC2_KALBG|nr:Survival protein SurE-like phosphatase/nucleotidase [Kalmanozyma brasiliensis GHG001]EST07112.1 Survival protein SurE-like phosphatase/nucleotidase [Kalmanozyma brasiliensis GHG001]
MPNSRPKVLLVNDDGPPSTSSPHVLGLYSELTALGWDVSVVLPSFQKSWGSMQFSLQGPVAYWYYYPLADNFDGKHAGTAESWSATRRPINRERGEIAEWILIDGSPTTASNSGLFNQNAFFGSTAEEREAPASTSTPFDLVVSGPNFGRNTGTAFALSSGTLGAAMAASLAGVRSIAVSFGHFTGSPPTFADRSRARGPALDPPTLRSVAAQANRLSASLIQRLYSNWDSEPDVGCYSINVPLCETVSNPEIVWTRIWENRYGPLFAANTTSKYPAPPAPQPATAPKPENVLHFAPNMASLLGPKRLPEGTDVWAILNGYVSVTRLRPNFMEVDREGRGLDVPRAGGEAVKGGATERDASEGVEKGLKDGLDVGTRWRL